MSGQVLVAEVRGGWLRPRITALALALAALLLGGCAWGITQPAEDVGLTSATVTGIVAELSDGTATDWFEQRADQELRRRRPPLTSPIHLAAPAEHSRSPRISADSTPRASTTSGSARRSPGRPSHRRPVAPTTRSRPIAGPRSSRSIPPTPALYPVVGSRRARLRDPLRQRPRRRQRRGAGRQRGLRRRRTGPERLIHRDRCR